MSCSWWFGAGLSVLKATVSSLSTLLTTKAEAWRVRVASTHARCHTHVTRITPRLNGVVRGVGMDDAERVLELLLVAWGRP